MLVKKKIFNDTCQSRVRKTLFKERWDVENSVEITTMESLSEGERWDSTSNIAWANVTIQPRSKMGAIA